jgi:hypothetical protein
MAGFDYTKSADTALRLLERFGRPMQLTRLQAGTGPTHNPGPPLPDVHTVVGVSLPATSGKKDFDNWVEPGTLITDELRYVLIAAKGLAIIPATADYYTFDGYNWAILGSTPLAPAGVPILYKTGCRRL